MKKYSYTNQTLSDVKHINACSVEVSEVTIKNGGLLYIDSQNGTTLYDINVEVGGELEIH